MSATIVHHLKAIGDVSFFGFSLADWRFKGMGPPTCVFKSESRCIISIVYSIGANVE